MNTVLLRWNPLISSMTYQRHADEIVRFGNDEMCDFNWSVWDHEHVNYDDRFLMMCCGGDKRGIVMSGVIGSEPYEGKSWRGDGKEIYYCDMEPDFIIDPLQAPILTSETLYREIPEYDWEHGHAGVLLDDEVAAKLELLWFKHLYEHRDMFEGDHAAALVSVLETFGDGFEPTLQRLLSADRDGCCEVCGYNYQRVFGPEAEETPELCLLEPYNAQGDCHSDPLQGVHCLCDNCRCHLLDSGLELNEAFYRLKGTFDK